MEKQNITIESNWWQGESQIDLAHLRDIELRIIASMYKSKELFEKITSLIKAADFTFTVNKKIYEYLTFYAKEDSFFGDDSKKMEIALNISDIYNIGFLTILKIFDGKIKHYKNINDFIIVQKEDNLDLDIFELLDFSEKRKEIISQNNDNEKAYSNIQIEDEYGFYGASYSNGLILEVGTTYIFHLPEELCDVFKYTFENIMSYIQTNNYDVTMQINEDDSEDIQAFCLKKNIDKIEQIEKLIQWANDNSLSDAQIPRNRGRLLEPTIFEEFDNCNLKTIPSELFETREETFSFNFSNNKIKELPSNIRSSECSFLMLYNNEISEFPKSVYELKELSTLCLHGNKIKSLPNDINQMKKLKKLTISNNPIEQLPKNISYIETLKELDIENTLLDENSLEYLQLENFEKISFDDKLLPWFIKNFHRLKNIDTINLVHSDYKIADSIFDGLSLEIDTEKWMDEKDYQGHGCIRLSKKTDPLEDELDF